MRFKRGEKGVLWRGKGGGGWGEGHVPEVCEVRLSQTWEKKASVVGEGGMFPEKSHPFTPVYESLFQGILCLVFPQFLISFSTN